MDFVLATAAILSLSLAFVMFRTAWRLLQAGGRTRRTVPGSRASAQRGTRTVDMSRFRPAPAVAAATPPATGRRVMAVAAVVVSVGAGFALVARSGETLASFGGPFDAARVGAATPLELVAVEHRRMGRALHVTGVVEIPATGRAMAGVVVTVEAFDSDGRVVADGRAALDGTLLQPGDQSEFVVTVSGAATAARYRIAFSGPDGRAVNHLDRRPVGPAGPQASPDAERAITRTPLDPLDLTRRVQG